MSIRNLLPSFAIALMAFCATTAQAQQIDVSLNLRYDDPADPSEGGTWELVALYDEVGGSGIAAVNALISNIDNGAGQITLGSGISAIDPICAIGTPCDDAFVADGGTSGGAVRDAWLSFGTGGVNTDLIYGQNLIVVTDGVGTGAGSAGDNGADVLQNSFWDNAALLASGTFGAVRPGFTTKTGTGGTTSTGANYFDNFAAPTADDTGLTVIPTVRGDSENSEGLETGTGLFAGDASRDGAVGPADLGTLGVNWNPTGTAAGWDDGDFGDDGNVGPADLAALGVNWDPLGSNFNPPALGGLSAGVGAVPEPSSILLCSVAAGILFGVRRRR